MFRYPDKRPSSKAAIKARPSARPTQQARQSNDAYRVFFSLVMAAFAARVLFGCIGALTGWQPVAQVGDRLIFTPLAGDLQERTVRISARLVMNPWSRPGPACGLETATMIRRGGAMTVLAVRQDGVMLSWAGGATASAGSACQGGESLLVTDVDYQQLLTAQVPRAAAKS